MSRARNLSGLMGTSATLDVNDIADAADLSGVEIYEDSDAQAAAVYIPGRQIYRRDLGAFQIHNGSSWRTIDFTAVAEPILGFQGNISGYTSGGVSQSNSYVNTVQKWSFSADTDAANVGALTVAREAGGGNSSAISGYSTGGYHPVKSNIIDKFPFAADGNATDVGDLTIVLLGHASQSSSEHGYSSGGYGGTGSPRVGAQKIISKFAFASDGNAAQTGFTTGNFSNWTTGHNSLTNGYQNGGNYAPKANSIYKFPFASDANATQVATLVTTGQDRAGSNSPEYGYVASGTDTINIEKHSFTSDTNATTVGALTVSRQGLRGNSSTSFGYSAGGRLSPSMRDVIDKFPFAADGNATDVGNLTVSLRWLTTQQI